MILHVGLLAFSILFLFGKLGYFQEHHWDIARDQSRERVAGLEAELGKAQASVAEATAGTAEAELKLEQLRIHVAPRHIQRDAFLKALERQPKARVEIMFLRDDPECFDVAQQIRQLLQDARWDVVSRPDSA